MTAVHPTDAQGDPYRYWIAFAVVLASMLQVIDSSIVNVAIPHMMGTLGATIDEIAWVSTGYILASVVIIPLTGWLADTFGRKRYFAGSILLFTLASFFCGAAGSLHSLVIWRVIQGIGGGALLSTSQAIIYEAFPRHEAGKAMALWGMGIMVGPDAGPHPRRLADRQLRLALDLLRQSSGGTAQRVHGGGLRPRPGAAIPRASGRLARHPAPRHQRHRDSVPAGARPAG